MRPLTGRSALTLCLLLVPLAAQTRQPHPPEGRVLVRAPWGAAPRSFLMEENGARLGPSSLAVLREHVYVLDRVAGRVQVFTVGGALVEVLPVGSRSVDMLAVDGQGAVLVLDAFVRREVRILRRGKAPQVVSLPRRGRFLPSGIFPGRDVFLIEWQHGATSAVPCPGLRPIWSEKGNSKAGLPGRPTNWGWIRAARCNEGVVLEFGTGNSPRPRQVKLPVAGGVESVVALDADRAGRVMAAWVPRKDPQRRIEVALLSKAGKVLRRFLIQDGSITDLYDRLCLAPDGRLFQLRTSPKGVEIVRWDWQASRARKGGER